jgi:hypothetical protein
MPIQYNSQHVDEKYKPTLIANLFYKTVLIPGVTYQDVTSDNNGGWFWHKLVSTGAAEPGTPGRDFVDEASSDNLIQCVYNNNYQKSKKIYGVQAAAVAFPLAEEQMALATQEVNEGRNLSALGCLITEGTAAASATVITVDNFKHEVLGVRKEIVTAKGIADIVLCSPDFFGTMLEFAGEKFIPSTNEMLLAAAAGGQVGSFLGMTWMEANGLAHTGNVFYYDYSGTKKTVTATDLGNVDFIMYDHRSFGLGDNFVQGRLIDSEMFSGSKAQVEENTGMRVLNPTLVRVRKHA